MLTFNIRLSNGNFFRGYAPSNKFSNRVCGDQIDAMDLSIEQARLAYTYLGYRSSIVISPASVPATNEVFEKELFCLKGGNWYNYEKDKNAP